MHHWLVKLLHHRHEEQEMKKFFDVVVRTTKYNPDSVFLQFSFSLFDLIHADSSSVRAPKALASASSASVMQFKYSSVSSA